MPSSPKKTARIAKDAYEEGRKDERERCANLVERFSRDSSYGEKLVAIHLAAQIRAYG